MTDRRTWIYGLLTVYLLGGLVKVLTYGVSAIVSGIRIWEMPVLTAIVFAVGIFVPTELPAAFGLVGYGSVAIALLWRQWDISAQLERRLA